MVYKNIICIIIPVYNSEEYIKKCICSIQRQSFPHWRLILVDDGSTDRSQSICKTYSEIDDRIVLICQKNNGGAHARKVGVLHKLARESSYITFVDNDDVLPKNALEVLYDNIKKYNADIVCGRHKRMVNNIIVPFQEKNPCFRINKPTLYNRERIMNELFVSFFGISCIPVTVWGKMYKTDILMKVINYDFPSEVNGGDMILLIKIIENANEFVIIPNCVYYYRTGGETSRFRDKWMTRCVNEYNYKKEIGLKNHIPKQWFLYLDAELLNMFKSDVGQYKKKYNYDCEIVKKEIKKTCGVEEVRKAAKNVMDANIYLSDFAKLVYDCDENKIFNQIDVECGRKSIRSYIRKKLS